MAVETVASPGLLAALFRGLADPARLSCLLALRDGPRPVGAVVAATGLSQPSVSKHLACLRCCGLVRSERSGKFVFYEIADATVEAVLAAAATALDRVGTEVAGCPTYETNGHRTAESVAGDGGSEERWRN